MPSPFSSYSPQPCSWPGVECERPVAVPKRNVEILVRCPGLSSFSWCLRLYTLVTASLAVIFTFLWIVCLLYVTSQTHNYDLRGQRSEYVIDKFQNKLHIFSDSLTSALPSCSSSLSAASCLVATLSLCSSSVSSLYSLSLSSLSTGSVLSTPPWLARIIQTGMIR